MKLFKTGLVIMLAIALTSCLTTTEPFVPTMYSGSELIYPGVYKGVSEAIQGAYFNKCDIYANEFVVEGIQVMDGLNQKKFDLRISLVDNVITYEVENIMFLNSTTNTWDAGGSFLVFSKDNLFRIIDTKVQETLNDQELYQAAKGEALSDIVFLYSVIEDMNDIALEKVATELLVERSINFSGKVINIEEHSKTIGDKEYKYRVHFKQDVDELLEQKSSDMIDRRIGLFFHTNDESVVGLNKGSIFSTEAYIASIRPSTLKTFTFSTYEVTE